jgi:hypothetical protein
MANGKPNSICCRSAATYLGIENQLDIVRAIFTDGYQCAAHPADVARRRRLLARPARHDGPT